MSAQDLVSVLLGFGLLAGGWAARGLYGRFLAHANLVHALRDCRAALFRLTQVAPREADTPWVQNALRKADKQLDRYRRVT